MQLKAAFLLVFVGCLFCVVQGQEVNIKVVHAVAGAPNVDVYANGTLLVANAPYGTFTSYVPVRPGQVQLEVTATGNRPSANTTLISLNATLIAEQYYTIAAAGAVANVTAFPLELVVFNDTIDTVTNRALVRTIHLSAGSNPINVQESGQFIWRNIAYPNTGVPEYEVFNANVPNIIQIVDARTFRVQAGPTLLNFAPNSVNTIYYIGVENSLTTPLTIAFQQDYILGQVSPTRTPSSSQTPTVSFTSTISRTGSNSRTPSRTTSFSRTSTNTRTPSTTRSTNATDSASPTLSSTNSGSFTTTPSFTVSTSVTDFTTRSAFRTDNNLESRTVSLANSASRTRFTVQTQTQTRSPFRSAPDYSDDDDIIFASQSRTPVPTLQSSSRSRTRTGFSITATGTPTPTRNILSIFSASRTVGLVLPSVSPPIFGTFISRTPFTSLSVLPSVSAGCMPVISIMSTVMFVLFALLF